MQLIGTLPAPRLEIRDLRVVLALASVGTTARASDVLHLTQPAVSRALLAAEERLGARLFDRTARGLVPTPAGALLIDGATRLLGELDDLELRVRTPAALPPRLRLVCECYTAYHWLPTALSRLRELLPDLDIALAVEHTREPIAALAAGKIDIALLTTAAVPPQLAERALFSDEVVFVMAASHRLAARKQLTAADLRSATLLTSPVPLDEQRWFMTAVFGRARPKLRLERFPLTEAIIDVARAGMGVAILSEWIAAPHLGRGDLVARRLATGPLHRPWRIAWRPDAAAAIPRLCGALEHTVPRARLAA
ncbi:MAG TPA: LysR family transcriptional regulator [Kofleriaceae bacterium]|nr:LysR family transcriptional regulator [Kofleriaceae bacterium]